MSKTNSHSNKTPTQIGHDLEEIQRHLLLVKAACLAYQGCFQDCSLIIGRTDQSNHNVAEYFIYKFLELEPEQKLEAAMRAIWKLQEELKEYQEPPETCEALPKAKKTPSHTIRISIDGEES